MPTMIAFPKVCEKKSEIKRETYFHAKKIAKFTDSFFMKHILLNFSKISPMNQPLFWIIQV